MATLTRIENNQAAFTASIDDLRRALFDEPAGMTCWVATGTDDADVIGTAVCASSYVAASCRPVLRLLNLVVAEAHRGVGVGTALLHAVARAAHGRYDLIDFVVRDANEPAQAFYAAHGALPREGWQAWRLGPEALGLLATQTTTVNKTPTVRSGAVTREAVRRIGSGGDLRDDVRAWVASAPLRDLVRGFGGDADEIFAGDEPADWLRRLDTFSERWDSRRGAERNLAAPLDLTEDQRRLVAAAADALGLSQACPPSTGQYDHVLMLGGLVRACVARPAYAAQLIRSGVVRAGSVTALGGHRQFRGDEFDLARRAGLGDVSDEFSALDAGTRNAFGLGASARVDGTAGTGNAAWTIKTYLSDDGTPVRVAAAPSSDPEHRRANTADTYEWFARTVAALTPGETLLAITTAIYGPAQHAAALRMLALPYGVHVETVGVQPGDVVPGLDQHFTPSNYLQEIRSAIRAIRDLAAALPDRD